MATVLIDHTDDWIQADLEADPREWARACVLARLEERVEGGAASVPADRVEWLSGVLVPALEAARREDPAPVMLLFLIPVPDEPPVCAVTVRAEAIDEDVTLDDLLEEMRLPVEMLEQPALEEPVPTRGGTAVHLVQRYRVPRDAVSEQIQEHEAFVWRIADTEDGVTGDLMLYLSTSYVDLEDSAVYRPRLVALASTLVVVPG